MEERPLRAETAEIFGLPADTPATQVTRVLLMDGEPGAWMRDVVHPDIELPPPARIRSQLEKGEMVLDILLRAGRARWPTRERTSRRGC